MLDPWYLVGYWPIVLLLCAVVVYYLVILVCIDVTDRLTGKTKAWAIGAQINRTLMLAIAATDPTTMAECVRQTGEILGKYGFDGTYPIDRYQQSYGGPSFTAGSPNPAKLMAAYLELVDLEKIWGNPPSSACRNVLERIRGNLDSEAHVHYEEWIQKYNKLLKRNRAR